MFCAFLGHTGERLQDHWSSGLRNYCVDLNQILYESFQVQGNENLMTWCWSLDQDDHHDPIW